MNTENLKVGDLLEAIDVCEMNESKEHALIIGKHYSIIGINETGIEINSEAGKGHNFSWSLVQELFKIPTTEQTQDPKTMTIKEKTKLLKVLAKVVKATEKNNGYDGKYLTNLHTNDKIQEILKTI